MSPVETRPPFRWLNRVSADMDLYLTLSQQLLLVREQLADLLPGDVGRSDDVGHAGAPQGLAHVHGPVGTAGLNSGFHTSLQANWKFSHVILACALELVTRTMKSSPSVTGRSSQYTASPVAWLMAERCMMGRPTGSCSPWSSDTG